MILALSQACVLSAAVAPVRKPTPPTHTILRPVQTSPWADDEDFASSRCRCRFAVAVEVYCSNLHSFLYVFAQRHTQRAYSYAFIFVAYKMCIFVAYQRHRGWLARRRALSVNIINLSTPSATRHAKHTRLGWAGTQNPV